MNYSFYGWEKADVGPVNDRYLFIHNPCELYDALINVWCRYTCAPRMRSKWSENNKTVGQCSITAFLAQEIFGGKVYGIEQDDGSFHCFNVVGDCVFDLTSEQFGDKKIIYDLDHEQFRKVHFAKQEKADRYDYLKSQFNKYLAKRYQD